MAEIKTVNDRLGVFKELLDVPEARRFHQYASAYDGNDTWAVYRENHELSERMGEEWDRFGRRWKDHMADGGRHHALARPDDVEAWSQWMLNQFSVNRAYQHWNVIEGFYEWLKWHTEHPHVYNPFHMAARDTESYTWEIWQEKMVTRND